MSVSPDTLRTALAEAPSARLDHAAPKGAKSLAEIGSEVGAAEAAGGRGIALGCLYLRHGHLEAAHELSQSVGGPLGDWLHAIMHRMEGDYGNSRYWCGRAGGEAYYPQVDPDFTPAALTTEVEALHGSFGGPSAESARERQHREITVLAEAALELDQA